MRKLLPVLLILLAVPAFVFSVSLKDIVPALSPSALGTLKAGTTLNRCSVDSDIRILAPSNADTQAQLDTALSIGKGFTVTSSSLIPYPESWVGLSKEEISLLIYNCMLKVSTMKGLTYISHRAGDKEKTLFDDSSMLGSSSKNDRIADPSVSEIPAKAQYYVYQDDTTFGGNVYRLNYSQSENGLFMDITNQTNLSFLGISLVDAGKVSMNMTVVPVDEGIYVFSMATVRDKNPKVKVLFYSVDLQTSFLSRIQALRNWFCDSISR